MAVLTVTSTTRAIDTLRHTVTERYSINGNNQNTWNEVTTSIPNDWGEYFVTNLLVTTVGATAAPTISNYSVVAQSYRLYGPTMEEIRSEPIQFWYNGLIWSAPFIHYFKLPVISTSRITFYLPPSDSDATPTGDYRIYLVLQATS